jgi:hypothetical protein
VLLLNMDAKREKSLFSARFRLFSSVKALEWRWSALAPEFSAQAFEGTKRTNTSSSSLLRRV